MSQHSEDKQVLGLAEAVIMQTLRDVVAEVEPLDVIWSEEFEAWCATAGLDASVLREGLLTELGLDMFTAKGEWHD